MTRGPFRNQTIHCSCLIPFLGCFVVAWCTYNVAVVWNFNRMETSALQPLCTSSLMPNHQSTTQKSNEHPSEDNRIHWQPTGNYKGHEKDNVMDTFLEFASPELLAPLPRPPLSQIKAIGNQLLHPQRNKNEQEESTALKVTGSKTDSSKTVEKFNVTLKDWEGISQDLEVNHMDTLATVRAKVATIHAVRVEVVSLSANGQRLLDDKKTLKDYGIVNKDILELLPINLSVQVEGKKIPLTVKPTKTVRALKMKVFQKSQIPVEHRPMEFEGKRFDDDHITLEEMGINDGDLLNVV